MTPAITAFFKPNKPKETKVEDKIEEKADNDKASRPPSKADTVSEALTPAKRKIDDENVSTATKRQAVLPAATSTASKVMTKRTDIGNIITPVKQLVISSAQSPLMSVEAVIQRKISAGAYALHDNMGSTWFRALQGEFDKPYFKKLSSFVKQQRETKTVFPPPEQVFTWTHHHHIRDTRVVIIGQDPYHGPGQAHGLSFSVQRGVMIPKSLQNIYKELVNDIPGFKPPSHGDLTGWAKQGVLMLNACLTVNKGEANSHQGKGWEIFTDAVISWISKNVNHKVVFLLWGRFAQKKMSIIDKRHQILTAAHPSPLSADNGFFGCKHFSKTNAYLKSQRLPEIDWAAQ